MRNHPASGITLTGNFNRFNDSSIRNTYKLKQLVTTPTRGNNILVKVYTNMTTFYDNTQVELPVSTSDHCVVVFKPNPTYDILNVNRVPQKYVTVLDRFIISVSDVEKKVNKYQDPKSNWH